MDAFVAVGHDARASTTGSSGWSTTRWRGALRRAGTYPTALRAAARRGGRPPAAREKRARCALASSALAEEMRRASRRRPKAWSPAIHELLLARIDDIERYSMDDTVRPTIPMPR